MCIRPVGPLSIESVDLLLAAKLINILAASERQPVNIKLYSEAVNRNICRCMQPKTSKECYVHTGPGEFKTARIRLVQVFTR